MDYAADEDAVNGYWGAFLEPVLRSLQAGGWAGCTGGGGNNYE